MKAVTYLYRYQPAIVQWQLQAATKGTVWLPRDVFISSVRGRAWLLQDDQGRTWYPMAFREEVSESLDAVTQFEGHLLVRGSTLWIPLVTNPDDLQLEDTDTSQATLSAQFKGTRAKRTSAQTIANNTNVPVSLDTVLFDVGDLIDIGAQPTRITAPIDGYYAFGGAVQWDSNTTGGRVIFLRLNGSTELSNQSLTAADGFRQNSLSTLYHLNAGDYVELIARQNSGANRTILAGGQSDPHFWMFRVPGH